MSIVNPPEDSGNEKSFEIQNISETSEHHHSESPGLPPNLGFRFGDLSSIPDQIRSQLKTLDSEEVEILGLFKSLDGIASIDELLVALYRKRPDAFHDRTQLSRRLYRMVKRGSIFQFSSRRGFYTTRPDLAGEHSAEDETDLDFDPGQSTEGRSRE